MVNEKELVRRIRAGDGRAFEELVTAFEKKIYAMGLRFTGSPQDALDICQEVFLRVYRFFGSFGEESRLSTWIYRIAVNVCKDTVAKRGRTPTLPLEEGEGEESRPLEIADLRFSPEQALEESLLQETLARAIESLPDKYRQAVVLRDVIGLSYQEIGQTLGLEDGTVKSRIARARERLRGFLIAEGNILSHSRSKAMKGGDDA